MRTQGTSEGGFSFVANSGEKLLGVRVFEARGRVEFWVEFSPDCRCEQSETVQYLSPSEAMAFAKAFERCAIAALKNAS